MKETKEKQDIVGAQKTRKKTQIFSASVFEEKKDVNKNSPEGANILRERRNWVQYPMVGAWGEDRLKKLKRVKVQPPFPKGIMGALLYEDKSTNTKKPSRGV